MKNRTARVALLISTLLFGALIWILGSTPKASAIPTFSRKYQTSCTTCHSDFPELNDFGEAFKKNGFKFPKDDEMFVKEPPVLLGAKAQREAFPKAVWPGEIPGNIPVAFRYSGNFNYNSKQPISQGFLPRTDLFVPNTFTLLAARRRYTDRTATQTSTAQPTTSHSVRSGYTTASRTCTRNGPCAGSMPARASSHVSATVSGHGGQETNSMTMA